MHSPLLRRVTILVAPFAAALALSGADLPAPSARPAFTRASDIPVEYFFRPAALAHPQLNSAGTHLAVLAHDPKADANTIAVVDLESVTLTAARSSADYNIHSFQWADDDTLVFSIVKDRLYAWGLYAAHRDNPSKVTIIDPFDVLTVLGVPRVRPKNLKIWVHDNGRGKDTGVSEVEVPRGKLSKNPRIKVHERIPVPVGYDGVHRWLLDQDGEVRYALANSGAKSFLLRRDNRGTWTRTAIDLAIDSPLAVERDHNVLLVAHRNDAGGCDLVRYNTVDGSRGPALHSDAKYDFGLAEVIRSAANENIGLVYQRQATQQLWLRDAEEALQRDIDAALPPDHINLIVSRSGDGTRLVIHSTSDRNPGTIYFFDRERKILQKMGEFAPWLPQQLMAPVQLITYQTRDGVSPGGVCHPADQPRSEKPRSDDRASARRSMAEGFMGLRP